jgi:N-acetylneuraminic acid mutarotase
MSMKRATALTLITAFLVSTLAGNGLVGAVNEVDTSAFISVPATAEVAQVISVEMWIEPAPPNPTDRYHNITLTVTRPDGVIDQYTPMQGENNKFWWTYKPNQLGNFTFQFSYSGEAFDDGAIIYKPSASPVATLTVTGDPLPPVEIPGGSWTRKQSMNQARGGLGVAVVNGKIYAIGGHIENGSYSTNPTKGFVGTNEEYDPATDTWTLKTSMPTPRSNFAIAACKNKIYCISNALVGFKLDEIYHMFKVPIWSGVNEVYDPATDSWETKAPMPTAVRNAEANAVNGKIYIFDGNTTWVYDPASDSWSTKAEAPSQVGGYPSAVIDNKIYVISNYSPVQIYDTSTDSWSQGARSPRLSPNGVAAATTGKFAPKRIYLFTVAQYGWVPYGPTDISGSSRRTTFIYNPETDSWSAGAVMPDFRVDFGVAVINDKLYAVGGYVVDKLFNSYIINAKNEQYTPIGYGTPNPSLSPSPTTTPPNPVPEPYPVAPIATAFVATVILVSAVLLVYFKKRKP